MIFQLDVGNTSFDALNVKHVQIQGCSGQAGFSENKVVAGRRCPALLASTGFYIYIYFVLRGFMTPEFGADYTLDCGSQAMQSFESMVRLHCE